MEFWKTLGQEINQGHRAILMYVVQSTGSSPGRQGFKMFVSSSGLMLGSIGGGFMEHKWVDNCKKKLLKQDFKPFLKHQVHQKEDKDFASGLICSGEQTIAFYTISNDHISLIHQISKNVTDGNFGLLKLNERIIQFFPDKRSEAKFSLQINDDFTQWTLQEDIGHAPQLYIAGGGHVSLALSKLAHQLGFRVKVFDNRKDLNTVERNEFAENEIVKDYRLLAKQIPIGKNSYVVLMSFGYVTDKIILKSVLQQSYKYLGMMGSRKKVDQLFQELKQEGYSEAVLETIHAPIGLQIHSKTPEEIAISILAELIKVKNG